MKASNVGALVALLVTYMRRRVLSQGPLRDPLFRLGAAVTALLSVTALTVIAFLFLRPVVGDGKSLEFTIRIASISTVYWSILAFLFVRILFSRSSDMMKFTWQLPLTNQERAAALSVFEAIIVLGVTGLAFVPLAAATVLLAGGSGLILLLEGVAFPAFVSFGALSLVNNIVLRCLNLMRLTRIASLASFVACAAVFGLFSAMTAPVSNAMADDFLQGRNGYHITDSFLAFAHTYNDWAAIGVFMGLVIPLLLLGWLAVPSSYTPARKFFGLRLPQSWTRTSFGLYQLAWLRRADSWLAFLATYAVAGVLIAHAPSTMIYSIGILTTQSLYQFSATRTLRQIPGAVEGPGSSLVLLLASQIVGMIGVSSPILLFAAINGTGLNQILWTIGACVSGVILLNLLGILFPLDRDNPFSALVSYLVCLIVIATLVIVLGVIDLPIAVSGAFIGILHVAGLYYSHLGIRTSLRKARYA